MHMKMQVGLQSELKTITNTIQQNRFSLQKSPVNAY